MKMEGSMSSLQNTLKLVEKGESKITIILSVGNKGWKCHQQKLNTWETFKKENFVITFLPRVISKWWCLASSCRIHLSFSFITSPKDKTTVNAIGVGERWLRSELPENMKDREVLASEATESERGFQFKQRILLFRGEGLRNLFLVEDGLGPPPYGEKGPSRVHSTGPLYISAAGDTSWWVLIFYVETKLEWSDKVRMMGVSAWLQQSGEVTSVLPNLTGNCSRKSDQWRTRKNNHRC